MAAFSHTREARPLRTFHARDDQVDRYIRVERFAREAAPAILDVQAGGRASGVGLCVHLSVRNRVQRCGALFLILL